MFKINESIIVIQAEAINPIQTNVVFWSHDRGTAKLRMKLVRKNGIPQSLPEGTTVPIRLMFRSATAEGGYGKHDYLATVEDPVNGIVSIVLEDNILGYVGTVEGSVYIDFPNDRSLDTAGRFTFYIKRSPIDDSTPELEDYYFNGFSQTIDKIEKILADGKLEIEKKIAESETQIDAKLKDTNDKITKADQDVATLNTNIDKTDDRIDQINQQIGDIVKIRTDINTLKINKADKKDVDAQLATKAEQSKVSQLENQITIFQVEQSSGLTGAGAIELSAIKADMQGNEFPTAGKRIDNIENIIFNNISEVILTGWVQGGLSSGNATVATTRIRNDDFKTFTKDLTIIISEGYKLSYTAYKNDKSYGYNENWKTDTLKLSDNKFFNLDTFPFFKFVIAKTDDSNITTEESINVHFYLDINIVPSDKTVSEAKLSDLLKEKINNLTDSQKDIINELANSKSIEKRIDFAMDNKKELSFDWEVGSISNGVDSTATTRLRTKGYATFNSDVEIIVGDGYQAQYLCYSYNPTTGEYTQAYGSNGWKTGNFKLSDNKLFNLLSFPYYRFVLSKIDNSDITKQESINVHILTTYESDDNKDIEQLSYNWEVGNIAKSIDSYSLNRIRTIGYQTFDRDAIVVVAPGYKARYLRFIYDSVTDKYLEVQGIGWTVGTFKLSDLPDFNIKNIPYYRFVLARLDEVNMTSDESENLKIYYDYGMTKYTSNYYKKEMFSLGDSYTHMATWQSTVVDLLGLKTYRMNAVYGGTLTDRYRDVESTPDTDIVTVWYGTNDWVNGRTLGSITDSSENPTTFYGCLKYVCEWLGTNRPTAKILFITHSQRFTSTDTTFASTNGVSDNGHPKNGKGNTLEDFANAIVRVANMYGYDVCDLFHTSGINKHTYTSYYDSDGLHPSKKGGTFLGRKIAMSINKG
ncbi:TPA: GDSL-type esterase/lipase family protein [Enterococcus faecium]